MILCANCGGFIGHDSSNLSHICDACRGADRIRELEAEIEKFKEEAPVAPLKEV